MDLQSKHFIFKEVSDKVFNHLKPYLIFFFHHIKWTILYCEHVVLCCIERKGIYSVRLKNFQTFVQHLVALVFRVE